jgi:hypothetical protein
MKRRIMSFVLATVFCLSALLAFPRPTYAAENIKIARAEFFAVGAYVYCDFYLAQMVKPARNFQTTERKEEPSDFPDAMVEQAITNFYLNDIPVADYSEAFDGSQYVIMLHFENSQDNTMSLLRVLYMPIMIPGTSLNDPIKVEIKDGFITADYQKINPFVATYDPGTKQVTVVQEGGNPVTPTVAPQSSSPASSASQSSSSSSAQSSGAVSTVSESLTSGEASQNASEDVSGDASSTDATSGTSSGSSSTDVISGGLGSFDITSKKADATIDFPVKKITLANNMKVSELTGMLDVLEGLSLKFFSGTTELSDRTKLQNNDVMKVYRGEQLLGEFTIAAPASSGNSNTGLIIAMVVIAVLLIGGAGAYLFVFKNKKPE